MMIKQILEAFFAYRDGYDGEISCRKEKYQPSETHTFYTVETEGETFDAAICGNVVFFKAKWETEWESTDGLPVIEVNGIPYLPPEQIQSVVSDSVMYRKNTPSEIAAAADVSVSTVYSYAKRLGRLPTVEDIKNGRKKGRPKKYE